MTDAKTTLIERIAKAIYDVDPFVDEKGRAIPWESERDQPVCDLTWLMAEKVAAEITRPPENDCITAPIWRVSYRYKDSPDDSYDSRPSSDEAETLANALIAEPDTYSNVRISWPHYPNEMPEGEGWVAVEDLTPEQRQSLELLLMPQDKPQ
jgi:hypothetical protein